MCGRLTLTCDDLSEVAAELEAEVRADGGAVYRPRYNLPPGDTHWVAVRAAGRRELVPALWGWLGPKRGLLINARGERLANRPARAGGAPHGGALRCIVPADGFYEWALRDGKRWPIRFHRRGGGLLWMAGLFRPPESPEAPPRFVVVTLPAAGVVAEVHHRMPLLLPASGARAWLEEPDLDLRVGSAAAPPVELIATPASPRVNSIANDDAACLDPPSSEPAPRSRRQLDLF